jgi:hypothetical protein
MKLNQTPSGASANPQWWPGICVVVGLVVGAGGLLPSLFHGEMALPTPDKTAGASGADTLMPAAPSPAAMLGRLAAGTVLVLALCAGTLPLMRRWLVPAPVSVPDGDFEIVATLPLAGRCSVCLVRAGAQHLLAGSDACGLQALVPVGDVPSAGEWDPVAERRVPAGIEPRRLNAV